MDNINTTIIRGRLGRDADIRTTNDGKSYARMNVAVSKSWKDRDSGEWVERTTWVPVITFQSGLVDKVLKDKAKKGVSVLIKGEISGFDFPDKNDIRRIGIEVLIGRDGSIEFLGANSRDKSRDKGQNKGQDSAPPPEMEAPPAEGHPEARAAG